MKSFKYYLIMGLACLLPIGVQASANDVTEVASELALENCLRDESFCKLTADVAIRYSMGVHGDTILDLNGHTISPADSLQLKGGFIVVERGAKLTVEDNKGTGKISSGDETDSDVWAGIQVGKDVAGNEVAELVVNGGTIEGYYYGVVGNGNTHNSKITINNGVIRGMNKSDSVGLYHPQIGELIINGGTIKGGTGVEVRSGTVTVNNGTIVGEAPSFSKVVNGGGSTTNGVGFTVAQHTTKNVVKVTINGGDISGQYAFYEWNPHDNSESDLDKVSIRINGGNFRSTMEDGFAVYSQDFTNFIAGGKFNTSVSEYLTEDAKLASKVIDEMEDVSEEAPKKKSKAWIVILALALAAGGASVVIVYKKKVM